MDRMGGGRRRMVDPFLQTTFHVGSLASSTNSAQRSDNVLVCSNCRNEVSKVQYSGRVVAKDEAFGSQRTTG